jgi:MATE family multidrug resistance protein
MVSKVIGARQWNSFGRVLKLTGLWSFSVAVGMAVFLFILGEWMLRLLTTLPDVLDAARQYLPWLVLTPLVAVWPFWLDGVFVGATWSRAMRNSMVFSALVFYLAWLGTASLGNHGLWLSMMLFFVFRGVTLGWVLQKKWAAAC